MSEQLVKMDQRTLDSARLARGLTWAELGRLVGLSAPTRTKVTNGGAVSIRTVGRLARFFRLPIRKLFRDEAAVGGSGDGGNVPQTVGLPGSNEGR